MSFASGWPPGPPPPRASPTLTSPRSLQQAGKRSHADLEVDVPSPKRACSDSEFSPQPFRRQLSGNGGQARPRVAVAWHAPT